MSTLNAIAEVESGLRRGRFHLIDLDALIARANEMIPLPISAVRLASLVSIHHYNASDVVEVVAMDPALTFKLLRCANSVASAGAVPVTSVKEAVLRLGSAQILSLAVASHARPLLRQPLAEYRLDEGQLWRHSVASALVAESLPSFCTTAIPPESFTAALLHDIGKLVMARFLDPEILDLLARARAEGGLSPLEAERQILDVHHGELGGLVAQHWKLPYAIVKGINYHHDPEQGNETICHVVYLANLGAKKVEAILTGQPFELAIDEAVLTRLGTDLPRVDKLCTESAAKFTQVCSRYDAR